MNIKACLLFLIMLVLQSACSLDCTETNCDDYTYRDQAQDDYERDADCHGDLDHDNDGLACEHLPERPTSSAGGGSSGAGCPPTSNCGCSNKNKSDCPSTC